MEETEVITHIVNGTRMTFMAHYQASIVIEENYAGIKSRYTKVFPYQTESETAAIAAAAYHIADEELPAQTPITVTKTWLRVT